MKKIIFLSLAAGILLTLTGVAIANKFIPQTPKLQAIGKSAPVTKLSANALLMQDMDTGCYYIYLTSNINAASGFSPYIVNGTPYCDKKVNLAAVINTTEKAEQLVLEIKDSLPNINQPQYL